MTKTLTEQWREGTLPEDCYYILTKNGHIRKDRTCFYSHTDEQCFRFTSNKDIQEVLAPVPNYEEFQRLREQLKEANDLLKGLYDDSPCQFDHHGYCQEHGSTDGNYICVQGELKEYFERYGVK